MKTLYNKSKAPKLRPGKILHIIDSLNSGGAERMAVNFVNELSERGYPTYLCATRSEGPLKSEINPGVNYFCLFRRSRYDLKALMRLVKFTRLHGIEIIHAHSSSIFIAKILTLLVNEVRLLWHVHYGELSQTNRLKMFYRFVTSTISGIIVVNQPLKKWAIEALIMDPNKVWLLPNFVKIMKSDIALDIPGVKGYRIVSVANLRPEKDHLTLIRAMKIIVDAEPDCHLLLAGSASDETVKDRIFLEIKKLNLQNNVTWLGPRIDISGLISNCDIGVLSSVSEGLPLALLEYGAAGLPVVVTDVGDSSFVVNSEKVGVVVPPQCPQALANGLLMYLRNPSMAIEAGKNLQNRITQVFSAGNALNQLEEIYQQVLNDK